MREDVDYSKTIVSRRSFLKLAGILAGGAALGGLNIKYDDKEKTHNILKNKPNNKEVERLTQKDNIAQIIEYIKNKYNCEIIFPDSYTQGEKTNEWQKNEIDIFKNTLDELPETLTKNPNFPKVIYLFKVSEQERYSYNGLVQSAYGNREIFIAISDIFEEDKIAIGIERQMFVTQGESLSGSITHEITHSFLEAYPKIFDEWIKKFFWYQNLNGSWSNLYPENIIPQANAEMSPEEDFAVSVSVYQHNRTLLSKDRIEFLEKYIFVTKKDPSL